MPHTPDRHHTKQYVSCSNSSLLTSCWLRVLIVTKGRRGRDGRLYQLKALFLLESIAVLKNSITIAILRYIIMNLKSEQFCILRAQSGTTNLFDLSSNSAQRRLRGTRRTRVKIVEQREEKSWVRFLYHSASVYHNCCFQFQAESSG